MRYLKNALSCTLLACAGLLITKPSFATTKNQLLVEKTTLTVQDIFTEKNKNAKTLLKKAQAVMICPSILNVSVIFGGSGGKCLLLSRDAQNSWSDPAFYHLSSGSFGIQLGYQNAQLILFIMSHSALQSILDHQFTFNAGAGLSFANANTSTANTNINGKGGADIYTLQRSNGVFAGASLGGSKLTSDSEANKQYYGKTVGPEDIVVHMNVNNAAADNLRRALINASH